MPLSPLMNESGTCFLDVEIKHGNFYSCCVTQCWTNLAGINMNAFIEKTNCILHVQWPNSSISLIFF